MKTRIIVVLVFFCLFVCFFPGNFGSNLVVRNVYKHYNAK